MPALPQDEEDEVFQKLKSLVPQSSATNSQIDTTSSESNLAKIEGNVSTPSALAQLPYATEMTTPVEDDQEASDNGYF